LAVFTSGLVKKITFSGPLNPIFEEKKTILATVVAKLTWHILSKFQNDLSITLKIMTFSRGECQLSWITR